MEETANMSYKIGVSFVENNTNISQYAFEIIDRANGTKIDQLKSTLSYINYDFTRE